MILLLKIEKGKPKLALLDNPLLQRSPYVYPWPYPLFSSLSSIPCNNPAWPVRINWPFTNSYALASRIIESKRDVSMTGW